MNIIYKYKIIISVQYYIVYLLKTKTVCGTSMCCNLNKYLTSYE